MMVMPSLLGIAGVNVIGWSPSSALAEVSSRSEMSESSVAVTVASAAATLNYPAWAAVLETYVDEQGLVDYVGLQRDRQQLDAFNGSLAIAPPETYDTWSEADQIAFLINAYNSLTLKSIIDQSPIKASIRDIRGVWRFERHLVLQERQTLDHIEHDILRADFNEPRIHAALVCAALSCPYLRQEPYTGENLDAQLDDQVKTFLSRPEAFAIDRANNRVELSRIFKWFGEDWVPSFGTDVGFEGDLSERAVLNFISGYLDEGDRAYLQAGGYEIDYTNYDWALNQQPE